MAGTITVGLDDGLLGPLGAYVVSGSCVLAGW